MSFDLAISEHGDLVLAGHRDLGGKSGTDLLEQRMLLRLRLMRGAWTFDDTDTLGSNLHHISGMAPAKAIEIAPAYVREALRPVDDVTIEDVKATTDGQNLTMIITYRVSDVNIDVTASVEESRQLEISLPLSGGGG